MSNICWKTAKDLDLDALAELGSLAQPNQAQAVHAAFQRLQTKAMQDEARAQIEAAADQKEAANAQIRAAIATEATAVSTSDSARWLMWSVIAQAPPNADQVKIAAAPERAVADGLGLESDEAQKPRSGRAIALVRSEPAA